MKTWELLRTEEGQHKIGSIPIMLFSFENHSDCLFFLQLFTNGREERSSMTSYMSHEPWHVVANFTLRRRDWISSSWFVCRSDLIDVSARPFFFGWEARQGTLVRWAPPGVGKVLPADWGVVWGLLPWVFWGESVGYTLQCGIHSRPWVLRGRKVPAQPVLRYSRVSRGYRSLTKHSHEQAWDMEERVAEVQVRPQSFFVFVILSLTQWPDHR